ncbi:dihydrolipoamide acetyltransferase family protein [Candidatus Poriferisodalis sp.]|uniref:dihydrolipoamide acetyltransferase family protein n=1 Tax=Candidatus Poriferisodalis sp. TaxID=3101277 RepID=UPI003B01F5C6
MAVEFGMPKLGLTMESGTILRWLVADRVHVASGQPVVLVETDKVETEIVASDDGVLHQTGEVGQTYECGVRIGWFTEPGQLPPHVPSPSAQAGERAPADAPPAMHPQRPTRPASSQHRSAGGRVVASPAAKRLARELGVELADVAGTGAHGRITERDVRAVGAPAPADGGTAAPSLNAAATPPATLAARQLADLLGADLRAVQPTADDGRISRADVAAHIRRMLTRAATLGDVAPSAESGQVAPAGTAEPTAPAPLVQPPTELIPLQGMRGVIAQRMTDSLRSTAQLTLTVDVDLSAVAAERGSRAAAGRTSTAEAGPVPGYTDYVVAAAAAALRVHPRVNSQVTADAVALLGEIHVGLAVALDDGLLVPVIRHADQLSLGEIAAETKRLAAGARQGSLDYADYQGSTFTVTALGAFGVDVFTPILNSPNTAILGVGRVREATVWADGVPAARPTMTLSLTWDHRAFDGAPAARFAGAIRDWLESREPASP